MELCQIAMFLGKKYHNATFIKGYVNFDIPQGLCSITTFDLVDLCQISMFLIAYVTMKCYLRDMLDCNFPPLLLYNAMFIFNHGLLW